MATLKDSPKISLGTVLFLVSVLLIVSNSCALAHTDVTAEQAKDLIDSTNDLVVVDVREQYEYCDERGHIPGALNYPLSSGVLDARYEELPKENPILVVCRSGGRSNAAANFLDSKGFSMIYDMMGGMTAWLWETEPCKQDDENEIDSTETNTYVFLPEKSTLLQTGGIAGVNWNYTIEGHFRLTVDKDAGIASFTLVDANATDDSPFNRTLDPNEVFNMTSLLGTVLDETTISFTGIASDSSDIFITLTIEDDLASLVGQTIPPPNTADFFIYELDAIAQRKYSGGTGEPNDPYQIATAADLIALGETPEDYDKHFILTADIDLDPNLPGRKVFHRAVIAPDLDPNDTYTMFQGTSFMGVFNGDGHKILRLTIEGGNYLGLFGKLDSRARISQIFLEAVDIKGAERNIGSLVGESHGILSQCHSTGVVRGDIAIGGLVGINEGNITKSYSTCEIYGFYFVGGVVGDNWGSITESYSIGAVNGEGDVGGLAGFSGATGNVIVCYSTSMINGNWHVGGLMGSNYGSITESHSTGRITGNEEVGGLVGENGGGGSITENYSTGMVNGNWFVGGFSGVNKGSIKNSYTTGDTSGNRAVGGLVGSNGYIPTEDLSWEIPGSISNCYSAGNVSGITEVGGLVGLHEVGSVTASVWDIETSGHLTSSGGMGKTTTQMQMADTFLEAGWDFTNETENGTEDIWWMLEGQSYPRLWWQYGLAFSPYPQDHAINVIQPIVLNWLPGGSGLSHDVYFGEDEEVVANATTENKDIYRGRMSVEVTTYDPGKLELNKTYYWRVDEVNETNPYNLWVSNVWNFTTANYLVVDDFESYNDLDPEYPESNRIFNTWIDGYETTTNGSIVGCVGTAPVCWPRVHSGIQSMPLSYDNGIPGNYSEAIANVDNLAIGRDWTIEGVGILSLWFHGRLQNAAEPMYVALADDNGTTGVNYHDNLDAVRIEKWTEWTIDLQEFAVQGVDLANIDTISIGFGNKNNPQLGGKGQMKFDDIRLYRPNPTEPEL